MDRTTIMDIATFRKRQYILDILDQYPIAANFNSPILPSLENKLISLLNDEEYLNLAKGRNVVNAARYFFRRCMEERVEINNSVKGAINNLFSLLIIYYEDAVLNNRNKEIEGIEQIFESIIKAHNLSNCLDEHNKGYLLSRIDVGNIKNIAAIFENCNMNCIAINLLDKNQLEYLCAIVNLYNTLKCDTPDRKKEDCLIWFNFLLNKDMPEKDLLSFFAHLQKNNFKLSEDIAKILIDKVVDIILSNKFKCEDIMNFMQYKKSFLTNGLIEALKERLNGQTKISQEVKDKIALVSMEGGITFGNKNAILLSEVCIKEGGRFNITRDNIALVMPIFNPNSAISEYFINNATVGCIEVLLNNYNTLKNEGAKEAALSILTNFGNAPDKLDINDITNITDMERFTKNLANIRNIVDLDANINVSKRAIIQKGINNVVKVLGTQEDFEKAILTQRGSIFTKASEEVDTKVESHSPKL